LEDKKTPRRQWDAIRREPRLRRAVYVPDHQRGYPRWDPEDHEQNFRGHAGVYRRMGSLVRPDQGCGGASWGPRYT